MKQLRGQIAFPTTVVLGASDRASPERETPFVWTGAAAQVASQVLVDILPASFCSSVT